MRIILFVWLLCFALPGFAQQAPKAPDTFQRDIQFVPYRKGNKWGLMTLDKRWVLKPKHKFDSVSLFRAEVAVVKVKNKLGLIDTTGRVVVKPLYTGIYYSTDLQCYVLEREGKEHYFLHDKKVYISLPEGYLVDSGPIELYDMYQKPDRTKLEIYQAPNGKWGVLHKDERGKILEAGRSVPAQYDALKSFGIYYLVQLGDQWGVVGEGNKLIIPVAYESVKWPDFGTSYPVKKGGKWGLYTAAQEQQLVVPCIYDDVITAPYAEGYGFRLVLDGKMGYYSLDTKTILPPLYQFIRGFHNSDTKRLSYHLIHRAFNPGISPAISASGKFGYVGQDGYNYFED